MHLKLESEQPEMMTEEEMLLTRTSDPQRFARTEKYLAEDMPRVAANQLLRRRGNASRANFRRKLNHCWEYEFFFATSGQDHL